jgi:ABC-type amino acid transport substrate-binding protein
VSFVQMMLRFATLYTATALSFMSIACADFPRDAEDTLRQVEAGRQLRVGWSAAEPWVRANGAEPQGIEPDLIRAWAKPRKIRIQWVEAGEAQLVEALSKNSLDVAVAGFTKQAPWGGLIGQTQPYLSPKLVIGARPGTSTPESWSGVHVWHDPKRPEMAGLLRGEGAVPTSEPAPYAAAYETELRAQGFTPTDKVLRTERRTIATAPSENALTLSLDRFLHANQAAIQARLAQASRP